MLKRRDLGSFEVISQSMLLNSVVIPIHFHPILRECIISQSRHNTDTLLKERIRSRLF